MSKVHIAISRPLVNPEWRSRSDSIELNQERFEGPTQPLTITFARGGQIEASHRSLPFAGASVDSIEIEEVLELVRDDRTLFAEITRVLVPGGTLRMRVPNRGAVAGFDSTLMSTRSAAGTGAVPVMTTEPLLASSSVSSLNSIRVAVTSTTSPGTASLVPSWYTQMPAQAPGASAM